MICALNPDGQLVYAEKIGDNRKQNHQWFCPICYNPVILKVSHRNKKFFSHIHACSDRVDSKRQVKETEMHQEGKEILFSQFDKSDFDCKLEVFFSDIQQTADVYVSHRDNHQKLILEFQHTPIQFDAIKLRTQAYDLIVHKTLWFANYQYFASFKKTAWAQTMLHYDQTYKMYYIPTIHTNRREIIYLSYIPLVYQKHYYQLAEISVNVADNKIKDLHWRQIDLLYKKPLLNKSIQRIQRNSHYRKDILALYEAGFLVTHLPAWVFMDNYELIATKQPFWLVVAWFIIIMKGFNGPFTFQDLWQNSRNHPQIKWLNSFVEEAQITQDTTNDLLKLFLKKDLVKEVSPNKFVYCYQY